MMLNLTVFLLCCSFLALSSKASDLAEDNRITELEIEVQALAKEVRTVVSFMQEISKKELEQTLDFGQKNERLNDTIEERVAVLEFQVAGLEDDVTTINTDITTININIADLGQDLDLVEGEMAVISAEQVLQDERILELEMDSDSTADSISALEAVDKELNSAVTTLDQSVATLNSSLGQLEDTVSNLDSSLTELDGTVQELEVELAETQGRIDKLEVSGTVAFHVDLDEYISIPIDSVVIFGQVILNLGDGYDSATGDFTVPSGGAGLYFFYTNFLSDIQEVADFRIRVNEEPICEAYTDINTSGAGDRDNPSCGVVTTLAEGDTVHVYYTAGTDDSPVTNNTQVENTFTGFRIAPE